MRHATVSPSFGAKEKKIAKFDSLSEFYTHIGLALRVRFFHRFIAPVRLLPGVQGPLDLHVKAFSSLYTG